MFCICTHDREKFFEDKKDKEKFKSKDKDRAEEDDSDKDLDEDDEFMQRYRQQRMKILSRFQERYGVMKEVTAWTFQKEVDQAPHDVVVVVSVFQDVCC